MNYRNVSSSSAACAVGFLWGFLLFSSRCVSSFFSLRGLLRYSMFVCVRNKIGDCLCVPSFSITFSFSFSCGVLRYNVSMFVVIGDRRV